MSEDHDIKSNNVKIGVTAVVSVLFGAAFIMALILFGMRVQTGIDNRKEEKKKTEEIVTINSVDFSAASFDYTVPSDSESKNYLINTIDGTEDDYLVINSKSKLEDVINAIRGASSSADISYSVDDAFFNSGSIIAVAREGKKLSDFEVRTVTRDADYNLQLDATEKYNGEDENTVAGRVVFVKISNIQPKSIEVKAEKE